MSDTDDRLEAVIARRNRAAEHLRKLEGRREAALASLKEVEDKCREHKLDPNQLDSIIESLETRYSEAVRELEAGVEKAEKALAPYME